MFALGAAQAVVSYSAQMADYSSQSAAWKANYVNSLAAGRDEDAALTQRELQEEEAFRNKAHLSLLEEAEAKSEGEVMAAGAGVGGISVDAMLREIGSQAAYNRVTEETNWRNTAAQLQLEKKASVTRTQSRINSVARPSKPGIGSLALGIAGAGVKSFGSM